MYALLVGDDFILVPNVAGLALFCVQLLVYRYYSPFCSKAPGALLDEPFCGASTAATRGERQPPALSYPPNAEPDPST